MKIDLFGDSSLCTIKRNSYARFLRYAGLNEHEGPNPPSLGTNKRLQKNDTEQKEFVHKSTIAAFVKLYEA